MGSTSYMDNGQLLLYENLVFSVFSYVHRKALFKFISILAIVIAICVAIILHNLHSLK